MDSHRWGTPNLGVTQPTPGVPISLHGPSGWAGLGLAGLLTQLPLAGHTSELAGLRWPRLSSVSPPPGGWPGALLRWRPGAGEEVRPAWEVPSLSPITCSALSLARADAGASAVSGPDEARVQRL